MSERRSRNGREPRSPVVGVVIGVVLIAIGWWGGRREELLSDQTPWIVLAVVGSVVVQASAAMWVMALRRAVAVRNATVRYRIEALALPASATVRARAATRELVAIRVPGARQFHDADCHLVAHRTALVSGSREEHLGAGLVPCRVCLS